MKRKFDISSKHRMSLWRASDSEISENVKIRARGRYTTNMSASDIYIIVHPTDDREQRQGHPRTRLFPVSLEGRRLIDNPCGPNEHNHPHEHQKNNQYDAQRPQSAPLRPARKLFDPYALGSHKSEVLVHLFRSRLNNGSVGLEEILEVQSILFELRRHLCEGRLQRGL